LLLAIARHKALSVLRRRTVDELDEETASRIEDPADNPEVALQKSQWSGILRDVLDELPAAQRQIMELVYYANALSRMSPRASVSRWAP
jgi:RNA polymerase sigma-70 factor (ECF subfamily)